jgi:DamX protein
MTLSSTTERQQGIFAPPGSLEEMYRNTALDMLATIVRQQLGETAQVQVIKGESGLGKTTLCKRLLLEAGPDLNITFLTADRNTGVAEILHKIAGGKEDDTRAPLQVLAKNAAQAIYQQLYNELQPVLLIDDAHCLPAQALANLFRFQSAITQQNTGSFKVILVGERKIDTRLEKVDKSVIARDRFLSNLLRPLSRNEIADYIDFKFGRVEGEKPKLNPKQLQYVRSNSGGIPGKIEELCLRALEGKTSGGKRPLTVLLLILIAGGGLAHHQGLYDFSKLAELAGLSKPERNPEQVTPAPQTPPATVTDEITPSAVDGTEATPATPIDSTPGTEPTDAPVTVIVDEAPQTPSSLEWLSNQPAEFYLIQLVGGHDPAKMEDYRQTLNLPHPLTLHKTERNGEDWYLLFYGPFPDYESAVEARALLPADLRKNQPWIRQIGSILEKQ